MITLPRRHAVAASKSAVGSTAARPAWSSLMAWPAESSIGCLSVLEADLFALTVCAAAFEEGNGVDHTWVIALEPEDGATTATFPSTVATRIRRSVYSTVKT